VTSFLLCLFPCFSKFCQNQPLLPVAFLIRGLMSFGTVIALYYQTVYISLFKSFHVLFNSVTIHGTSLGFVDIQTCLYRVGCCPLSSIVFAAVLSIVVVAGLRNCSRPVSVANLELSIVPCISVPFFSLSMPLSVLLLNEQDHM